MKLLIVAPERLWRPSLNHTAVSLPDFQKYHVFCDESATNDRYTVIGALVCHESVVPKFTRWLDSIVEDGPPTSELKWGKVKAHNLPRYKRVAAATMKACEKGFSKYYAIIIDNEAMNHKLFNEGDKEIGFNKMLFQLLYKLCRSYRNRPRFYAHLDFRTTKHGPDRLRRMLNAKAARDLRITHNPFRSCQFRKSHEVRLIQATDIIAGAIGYKANQKDQRTGAAWYKTELMLHITQCCGVQSLATETTFDASDRLGFDVWRIDLRSRAHGVK